MDTKTARRNFYQTKTYLNTKYHEEYTTERFSADLQYLLDEFIPNATLKQLTKFMEKKYARIVKVFPEVEKALKKVLKEKLNKMIGEIKKQQIQKLIDFIKQTTQNIEFYEKQRSYYFKKIGFQKNQQDEKNLNRNSLWMQFTKIFVPTDKSFILDQSQSRNAQKPFYKLTYSAPEQYSVRYFASTLVLELEKFEVNKGNFQRQANNFLYKLVEFTELAQVIENESE